MDPGWWESVERKLPSWRDPLHTGGEITVHTTDTPTVIIFFLRPRCWCGKTAGNNWVRLHSTKRSLKIMLWIEKFRCQNSNLNLPTIKNGFYSFSYLKDSFHIQIWIFLYFWNRWAIPVTMLCWISPQLPSFRCYVHQRVYRLFNSGKIWILIGLSGKVDGRITGRQPVCREGMGSTLG